MDRDLGGDALNGLMRVGRMLNDADAVDDIKEPVAEGKFEDRSLNDVKIRMRAQIAAAGVHRAAEVQGDDFGAVGKRDLRETSRAATHVQNELSAKILTGPFGDRTEAFLGKMGPVARVELKFGIAIPLMPKGGRIFVRDDKARNAFGNWKDRAASVAEERPFFDFSLPFHAGFHFQSGMAGGTGQSGEQGGFHERLRCGSSKAEERASFHVGEATIACKLARATPIPA